MHETTLENGLVLSWDEGVSGHLLWDGEGTMLGSVYDGNVAGLVSAMGSSTDLAYVPPMASPVAKTIPGHDPGEVTRLTGGMYLMVVHDDGDSLLRDGEHHTLATVFRDAAARLAEVVGRQGGEVPGLA